MSNRPTSVAEREYAALTRVNLVRELGRHVCRVGARGDSPVAKGCPHRWTVIDVIRREDQEGVALLEALGVEGPGEVVGARASVLIGVLAGRRSVDEPQAASRVCALGVDARAANGRGGRIVRVEEEVVDRERALRELDPGQVPRVDASLGVERHLAWVA